MNRATFDHAYLILDRIEKLKAIRLKMDREFPEFGYDTAAKELIGYEIYTMIDNKIGWLEKDFNEL